MTQDPENHGDGMGRGVAAFELLRGRSQLCLVFVVMLCPVFMLQSLNHGIIPGRSLLQDLVVLQHC